MTQRWDLTQQYVHDVFGRQDNHLAGLMPDAIAAGLPDIAVSAEVGRLLTILTSLTRGMLAIEVGTLAGYSGIWIARGLKPGGRLITIEAEPRHADFAQRQFERAGVAERVHIRRGRALDVLPELARAHPPQSVDLIFLDAVKTEYEQYWQIVRPLIAHGGLILADNCLGSNSWWIEEKGGTGGSGESGGSDRDAMDRFNRLIATDAEFDTVAVPLRNGVLVGRRRESFR